MKKFTVKVNDKIYDVEVEEINENEISECNLSKKKLINTELDHFLSQKHHEDKEEDIQIRCGKDKNILAPLPGVIIDIIAIEGKKIKYGDPVLILEAMKMENTLTSPITGKIKSIHVKKGDSVSNKQILITFE